MTTLDVVSLLDVLWRNLVIAGRRRPSGGDARFGLWIAARGLRALNDGWP
jgi:hypothetical protein